MQTQYLIRPEAPQVPPYDAAGMAQGLSAQLEDLGPTRSSQAARLTHIKPGYYTPPGRPVCVPGMQWLAVLLVGRLVEQGTHVHPRERSPLASTPTGGKPPGYPHQSTSRRR